MASQLTIEDPEDLVAMANDLYLEAKSHVEKSHKANSTSKLVVLSNLEGMRGIILKLSKPQKDLHAHYEFIRAENAALEKQVKEYEEKIDKIQEEFGFIFDGPQLTPDWMNTMVVRLEEHANAVAELRKQTQQLIESLNQNQARATNAVTRHRTIYSVLVTSELADITSDELIETIRKAVDARNTGIHIDKLRRARNDSVILGCKSVEVLAQVTEKILAADGSVVIEELKTKDPMVILRNVMNYYTDRDIAEAFIFQNQRVFGDINAIDFRFCVKYRKNAKGFDKQHIVMEVSPKMWQCMTKAGTFQIDVQRVTVEDHSPLIQCTRCLAYGHIKSRCVDLEFHCSHCSGPHTRMACIKSVMGRKPICRNCRLALLFKTEHNAFDDCCPVRKIYETVARSMVAYE